MPKLDLLGGYSSDTSNQFDAQKAINIYPKIVNNDSGKGNIRLLAVVGQELRDTYYSTQKIRIFDTLSASNNLIYILFAEGASSRLKLAKYQGGFTIYDTSNNHFSGKIVENGEVINIVTGGFSYFFNLSTNSLNRITDTDFPSNVIDVAFKDGYFVWTTTERFYVSTLFATDHTDCINALDFGVAESSPDKIVGVNTVGNEIAIFGEESIEFFYNSGNVDFPFERNSGVTIDIGTVRLTSGVSLNSIVKNGNDLFFIGREENGLYSVYALRNYSYKKISNTFIDQKLNSSSTVDVLKSTIINNRDDYFLAIHYLNAINEEDTLAYSLSTGIWSVFKSENDLGTDVYPCFTNNSYFNETLYVNSGRFTNISTTLEEYGIILTSASNFNQYQIDYSETGYDQKTKEYITIEYIFKHIFLENKTIQINSFELDLQKGTGNTDDQTPEISLYISRDGGETYGNEINLYIGENNQYKTRCRAQMLGIGRDVVFKINAQSRTQLEIFGAFINYEVLDD